MNKQFQSGLRRLGSFLAAFMLSAGAYAEDIKIEGVWANPPAPGRDYANVFMFISSPRDATLVGASSPAAGSVELRTMKHRGSIMKTIILENIPLPAGKRVDMTSVHGYHLTLKELKAPLEPGKSIPLTLEIETADKLVFKADIKAEIKPLK